MILAYLNYPNPHVTLHHDPSCGHANFQGNANQRHILLNPKTISEELLKISANAYPLSATAGLNDMWFVLDFNDTDFEKALAVHLKALIGNHYKPIRTCQLKMHC